MQDSLVRSVCAFSLGLALTACAAARSIGPAPPGVEAGPAEDTSIVTPGTNSIVVRVLAGLTPPNPPGPAHCDFNALYALNRKTHELSWEFCFVSEKSKRTLEPREVATLDAALARLKVVKGGGVCFPDAPTLSVTTTGDVTREYHADVCDAGPPLVGVDATVGLIHVLYDLTGN